MRVARERVEHPWRRWSREPRHSWDEIAEALGKPKATVHRRYGDGG